MRKKILFLLIILPSPLPILEWSLYCAICLLSDSIDGGHHVGLFVVNIETKHQ